MAKKARLAVLSLCLVLVLGGCAPFTSQNINDLLRAPALGQGQDEIQKALAAYLGGEELQYKFPREGDWRAPLIQADLNGDGIQEAILLYSMADGTNASHEKGNNVYVAVLEKAEGVWTVTQDMRGLSTEVASVEVADLLGTNTRQLIVGFATSTLNTKTLAVYTYDAATLILQDSYEYSRYEIGDFTGRGGTDLVVVSRDDQPGGLLLQYVATKDGRFAEEKPAPVKLDANFVSCAGICPGVGEDGARLLVVDGVTAIDTGALASQFVYYSGEHFYVVDDSGALRGATARLNSLLKSRDIDGDGRVEIPLRMGRGEVQTPAADKKLEFVEWVDLAGPEQVIKEYGILDSDRNVYIRLPEAWKGQIDVVDGAGRSEWRIQRKSSQVTLLSLVVYEDQSPPMGALRVPGTTSIYLVMASSMAESERNEIQTTAMN